MKWIGQHIVDLIARFRSDVYLESLATTTDSNVLVVDASGKVGKNTSGLLVLGTSDTTALAGDTTTITSGQTSAISANTLKETNVVQTTITGNAATATILASARAINGVDFNGSAPITITAAGSTLSDTVTVAKGGTGQTSLAANSLLTGNGTGGIVAESNFTYDGTNLTLASDGVAAPDLTIASTANHPTAGNLFFNKFRADDTPPDGMQIGVIHWNSEDDANNGQAYAQIIGSAEETGSGIEGGKLQLRIATHDGEIKDAIVIEDGDAEDEIDITIGQGASSLTTISGNLTTVGNIELGNASDTTLARTAAGKVTIEGARIKTQELYVKILPSDFIADDGGRPLAIDDSSSDRWLESHGTHTMFASVEIPLGFKATHVHIYGTVASAMTVYKADIDDRSIVGLGTGNIGTNLAITNTTADATNYILIQLVQTSGEQVNGGIMTIAAV